jgi:hypothetical protein
MKTIIRPHSQEQVLVIPSRQAAWADPITKAARPAGKEEKMQENLFASVPAHSKYVFFVSIRTPCVVSCDGWPAAFQHMEY